MTSLKKRWDIPDGTLKRFIEVCRSVSKSAGVQAEEFQKLVNYQSLSAVPREHIHVLVGILGFSFGGGEIFPIHLANALRRKGIMVSILQMHDADDHKDVRRMLDPGIPVYTANAVRDMGIDNFITNAGISVIHSHVANVEGFLLDGQGTSAPFISTLHGSYEAMDVSTSRIDRWSKKIDKFAYTADRNLGPFDNLQIGKEKFVVGKAGLDPPMLLEETVVGQAVPGGRQPHLRASTMAVLRRIRKIGVWHWNVVRRHRNVDVWRSKVRGGGMEVPVLGRDTSGAHLDRL